MSIKNIFKSCPMKKIKVENHSFTQNQKHDNGSTKSEAAGQSQSSCCFSSKHKCKCFGMGQAGFSWFALWLFTIGFLHLSFGKGLLALLLWPYYLGVYISSVVRY